MLMKENDFTDYILLFNMMHIGKFKSYADLIRTEGMHSAWCDAMDIDVEYFTEAYDLDYNEFRKAVAYSFNFHINYFLKHPDIQIVTEINDEDFNERMHKAGRTIWGDDNTAKCNNIHKTIILPDSYKVI